MTIYDEAEAESVEDVSRLSCGVINTVECHSCFRLDFTAAPQNTVSMQEVTLVNDAVTLTRAACLLDNAACSFCWVAIEGDTLRTCSLSWNGSQARRQLPFIQLMC